MNKKQKHNPSRIGDIAEFYAVTWLWDNGYEVYQNSGCTGSVDLIAVKDGAPVFIDVKSKGSDKDWGHKRTDAQKKLRVQLVEFDASTRKCRFINHRELHVA
jgi:Holliday junction resolvase-like predicted endonuclease